MYRFDLAPADVEHALALVREIAAGIESVEDPAFLKDAPVCAHELPRPLRAAMNRFRLEEPASICIVGGYPVDQERIGPTPAHWRDGKRSRAVLEEEVYFFLCACLLGDPIGWATQQDGYIMHDVLPIKGHELEQLGSGSEEILTWHTEDAFHPLRTDYIALMCLRNPDLVETTYARIEDIDLDEDLVRALRQRTFRIRPDRSHLPAHASSSRPIPDAAKELLRHSYEWISRLDEEPEPIEVLFGHQDDPYLRLDPFFMSPPDDDEANGALSTFVQRIDDEIQGYALRPGEIIFLDNYRAVHGRRAFKARFDGTDRWLKRLNIARDLRRSRASRISASSRVIY